MRGPVRLALLIALAHAVVILFHGRAHERLGIGISGSQRLFIAIVIVVAPVVAAVLLALRRLWAGGALLAAAMAGSLLFGLYYHFVAAGPDHVSSVASAGWGLVFQGTAALLFLTEALGCWAGVQVLQRGPAGPSSGP